MSEPFLAEIKPFAFNFAPRGWALCDGQLMSISQNTALFSLLGTTYGGDGRVTFALPDLRGRSPMHPGANYPLGTTHGTETLTLSAAQMPQHMHSFSASTAAADQPDPAGNLLATPEGNNIYGAPAATTVGSAIGASGGSQPFSNLQPYLVLNYCIALQGIFPSRD